MYVSSFATRSVHTAAHDWLFNTISVLVIRNLIPLCIVFETIGEGIPGYEMKAHGAAEVLLHSFLTLTVAGGE